MLATHLFEIRPNMRTEDLLVGFPATGTGDFEAGRVAVTAATERRNDANH